MKFQMSAILPDKKKEWKVIVDGMELSTVSMVEISSSFGKLTYGLRPEGYDGWVFHEQKGGGSILLPFIKIGDELFIGLISERRPNMGDEPVWNCIGGFVYPGESHHETMELENGDESGFDVHQAFELCGPPMNANRALFIADPSAGEGIHVFAIQLNPQSNNNIVGICGEFWEFQGSLIGFKKDSTVRFFKCREAIWLTPCALTRAAIAHLLADVL